MSEKMGPDQSKPQSLEEANAEITRLKAELVARERVELVLARHFRAVDQAVEYAGGPLTARVPVAPLGPVVAREVVGRAARLAAEALAERVRRLGARGLRVVTRRRRRRRRRRGRRRR